MAQIQLQPFQYYFRTLREVRGDQFGVILSESPPDQIHPLHEHINPGLMIALRGDYMEGYRGDETLMESLMVRYRPREQEHYHEVGPHGSLGLHIEFGDNWLEPYGLDEAWLDDYRYCHRTEAQKRSIRLLIRGLDPRVPIDEVEDLAFGVVEQFAPDAPMGEPAWVSAAIAFIHDSFADRLSLRRIAREVGISPMHLARTFRQGTGRTVTEYIRDVRLTAASRLVLKQGASLGEAAAQTGFCDQAYLSRCFRQEFSAPPRQLLAN